jgi:hypothetical protein
MSSATASAACSLLVGTSGLSDATEVADAPSDGGGDGDSTAPDVTVDRDAATATDGGTEPTIVCTGQAFCDTFDRTMLQGSWDNVTAAGGGAAAIDPTRLADGTPSLRVDCPTSNSPCTAQLHEGYAAATRLVLELRIRADALPSRDVNLVAVAWSNASRYIFFQLTPTGLAFVEQSLNPGELHAYPMPSFAAGKWQSIHAEMSAPSHIVVSVDGATDVDRQLEIPMASTGFELRFGVTSTSSGAAFSLWLDDLRFVTN